jgi:hypothetical protein
VPDTYTLREAAERVAVSPSTLKLKGFDEPRQLCRATRKAL